MRYGLGLLLLLLVCSELNAGLLRNGTIVEEGTFWCLTCDHSCSLQMPPGGGPLPASPCMIAPPANLGEHRYVRITRPTFNLSTAVMAFENDLAAVVDFHEMQIDAIRLPAEANILAAVMAGDQLLARRLFARARTAILRQCGRTLRVMMVMYRAASTGARMAHRRDSAARVLAALRQERRRASIAQRDALNALDVALYPNGRHPPVARPVVFARLASSMADRFERDELRYARDVAQLVAPQTAAGNTARAATIADHGVAAIQHRALELITQITSASQQYAASQTALGGDPTPITAAASVEIARIQAAETAAIAIIQAAQ